MLLLKKCNLYFFLIHAFKHLDPPDVRLSGTQKTVEGRNLNVTCSYIPGKPPATMFYWTKSDSDFRFNGQFLWIPSIGREDSGTYTCFAENTYSSGNKGKANATIEIDVQCQ